MDCFCTLVMARLEADAASGELRCQLGPRNCSKVPLTRYVRSAFPSNLQRFELSRSGPNKKNDALKPKNKNRSILPYLSWPLIWQLRLIFRAILAATPSGNGRLKSCSDLTHVIFVMFCCWPKAERVYGMVMVTCGIATLSSCPSMACRCTAKSPTKATPSSF